MMGSDGDEAEEDYESLDVRLWNDHSLVTELYKIDIENKSREQIKVEIALEPVEVDEPLNCILPVTSFYNQVLSNSITAKPATAIITKIDPSKPLGKLKMNVNTKIKPSVIGGNYGIAGLGADVGMRMDPTYTDAYRGVV